LQYGVNIPSYQLEVEYSYRIPTSEVEIDIDEPFLAHGYPFVGILESLFDYTAGAVVTQHLPTVVLRMQ
jgi:hypothetical protein